MKWDLFCRVIDNHGDLGVCWRLAADLGARGERVRLWVDDASALVWMAPVGAQGVEVRPWPDTPCDAEPGDVVIEAFACDPPQDFVERMAARPTPPVWINLEYLSAEDYVDRNHGLPSPQRNGLIKWFFYPGFTERSGGLLREPGLLDARRRFDATPWLAALGARRLPGERLVSLFCYPNPALPALLSRLAAEPTVLLATSGHAIQEVRKLLGDGLRLGALRAVELPRLTQVNFDRLLWACDLNFVRGEDSAVRAIWAGAPFVWQLYSQADGVHLAKMEAFLARFLMAAPGAEAVAWRDFWRGWNADGPLGNLPALEPWHRHCTAWRDVQATQPDLCTQLIGFTHQKR